MAPRPPTAGLDFFGFARNDTGALRKTSGVAEMTSWAAHWGGFSGNKPWSDNFGRTSHIPLTTLDWPSQNVEGGNAVPYSGLRSSTPVTPMGIVSKSPRDCDNAVSRGKGEYDLFGSGRGPRRQQIIGRRYSIAPRTRTLTAQRSLNEKLPDTPGMHILLRRL